MEGLTRDPFNIYFDAAFQFIKEVDECIWALPDYNPLTKKPSVIFLIRIS
jgi:hypothetical protein